MTQSYKTGTVTVTVGSTGVVGSGTAWALALATGGLFCCQGVSIPCTVVDDTHLTLDVVWPATSGAGKTYSIFRETAQAASAVLANDRLAEVADRLNKLSYINFDAMGILAQRAAYDTAPKDFIFLDIGVDPFALYIKASNAVGDWKGPNPYGQGPRGPTGADSTVPGPKGEPAGRKFTFSTTVTDANPGSGFLRFSSTTFASITSLFVSTTDGAAGGATEFLDRMGASSNADKGLIRVQHADNPAIYREFVVTGVTTATSYRKVAVTPLSSAGTLANNTAVMLTFSATGSQGSGFQSKGEYVAATAYVVGDVVSYLGSSYVAKAATTGNLPTNTTYWNLIAQKGTDGTASNVRELLTSARTYYIRTDGSDSNDGLANTSGKAFLTIQKAIDVTATLDMSIYDVTIQVGPGTYSQSINVIKQCVGAGHVYIVGDETTPSNVILNNTGSNSNHFDAVSVSTVYHLRGFKLTNPTGNLIAINANKGAIIYFRNIDFGACSSGSTHISAQYNAIVEAEGNWAISGGAATHLRALLGGVLYVPSRTITVTNNPAFSATTAFCRADRIGIVSAAGLTFSGATGVTGKRYLASLNGVINSNGAGATNFPGDVAGTTETGGQYG